MNVLERLESSKCALYNIFLFCALSFLNHRTNRTRQTGENQAGGTAQSRPCCPKLSLTDCAICTRSGKKGVSHVEQKKNWARLKQHPNERRLWFSFNISRDWYFNKWRDGGWLKKMHIILLLHKIRSCVCVRERQRRKECKNATFGIPLFRCFPT